MLLLQTNLRCLAAFADKKESGARWAVTGIQVEELPDNRYVAVATDTHALCVIEGTNGGDPSDYPLFGALVDAPNGATKGLIPADVFKQVLTDAEKATKKVRGRKPILGNVAVIMSQGKTEERKDEDGVSVTFTDPAVATFGFTNLEQEATPRTKLQEGRFPNYESVFPKGRGLCQFAMDPQFIIQMADVFKALKPTMDANTKRVEFDFYGESKPGVFRWYNAETNQSVKVLIMPLAGGGNMLDGFPQAEGLCTPEFWEKVSQDLTKELKEAVAISDKRHDLLIEAQSENRRLERLLIDQPGENYAVFEEMKKQIADLQRELRAMTDDRDSETKLREEAEAAHAELQAIIDTPPYSVTETFELADALSNV